MKVYPRIIPALLMQKYGLYKGIRYKAHRYVGDPINAVRIFNEMKADELMLLDISATLEGRGLDMEFVQQVADECYMPFSVGGGIRTTDHIRRCLQHGAEKVIINTGAIEDLKLISEAALLFGSQAVAVSIDYKRNFWGKNQVFAYSGTRSTALNVMSWANKVADLGAGEIILNAIDREGTYSGFDIGLISELSKYVSVPIVASCGAGSVDDIKRIIDAGASAVAIGSMFLFQRPHNAVLISYLSQEIIESLSYEIN